MHRPRRLLLASVLALSLAAVPATANAATTRYVTTTGSDSAACTQAAPCKSFTRAYGVAASGDTIEVSPGVYPAQSVPAGSKAVTFHTVGAAKLRGLSNAADNVTFDGLEIDANFAQSTGFGNDGANHVTFKNGRIGNVTDDKGALINGDYFTFENTVFHDVHVTDPSIHNECLYAIGVDHMTVRNNTFYACATMDIFFTWGTWWSPAPPAYGNVTLENNVFAHSTQIEPDSWHVYSVYVGHTGPDNNSVGRFDGWTVRNNTFEIPANVDPVAGTGSRWVGNLGGWSCQPYISYKHNVGETCGGSGKYVSASSSSKTSTAPFGWTDPAHNDFTLKSGSVAIGQGDPTDTPATDRAGVPRGTTPDAGAYQYQAGTSGGTTTPPPTTTTPTPPPTTTTTTPTTPTPPPTTDPVPSDPPTTDPVPSDPAPSDPAPSEPPVVKPPAPPATDSGSGPGTGATTLVGAWNFNETSGTTVKDTSGEGNNGTIAGGVTRTASGKFGRAATFDGSSGRVGIPDDPSLDFAKAMTLEAWVYPTSVSDFRVAVFKENRAAGMEAYALYAANGTPKPTAEVATGPSYSTLTGTATLKANTWTHLAETYDGTTLRMYVNGVEVGKKALGGSLVNSKDPLQIGGDRVWDEFFKGRIDEVRAWNGVRTAAQIKTDMSTPIG